MKKYLFPVLPLIVLSGCAHQQSESIPQPQIATESKPIDDNIRVIRPDIYQVDTSGRADVIREGRYTLVTLMPEDGQKYLLDQSVTINMFGKKKKALTLTVQQGLQTTLTHTGLSLCSPFNSSELTLSTLFSRSLPKVHYQFGPMRLRDALQMLAGPAYEITLNDITRTVCFQQRRPVAEKKPITPSQIETKTVTTTTTEIIEE